MGAARPAGEPAWRVTLASVLAAGVVVSLNVGKLPPALPALQRDFDLTLLTASLLVSFFQLAGMVLGLFGGMLADRWGHRRVMRIGLVIAMLGSGLGAVSPSGAALLASRAVESAGFILTVLPGPALLARTVPAAQLRAVLGLWSTYLPAGMAAGLVLAPWLMAALGWRAVWAAVALACLVLALLLGRSVPPDPVRAGPQGGSGLDRIRLTLRSPRPWVLALAFGGYAGQWMGVFGFLPTLFAEAGLSLTLAGSLTAVGVLVNLIGNLASGLLLQRGVSRAGLMAGAALAMMLGALLCFGIEAAPFGLRYAGVLLFSAAGGLIPGTLFASTAQDAPHRDAVATTTGLMQQGSTLGQFIAPPLIATVTLASGGWHHTHWVTAALACTGLFAAWAMRRFDAQDVAARRAV